MARFAGYKALNRVGAVPESLYLFLNLLLFPLWSGRNLLYPTVSGSHFAERRVIQHPQVVHRGMQHLFSN